MMALVWEIELPASDKLVLLALADCANDEGRCWPGLASLSRKTGRCKRSLQESLRMLDKAGHITRQENPGKGMNYTVHPVAETTTGGKSRTGSKNTHKPVAKAAPKPSRTITSKKDKPSSRARAKPKHSLPDDWQPKELTAGSICAQTVAAWQPGRIERELSKFRDHHLKGDTQWSDWDAAWRTWIQRASEFERDGQQRTNTLGRYQSSDGLSPTTRAALAVFGPTETRVDRAVPQ